MKIIKDPVQLKQTLVREKKFRRTVGFVPTMGALHEGHLSLIRASKRENDITVVSIFVNPTQFAPGEDLKKYPRVLKWDCGMLRKCGTDYLFHPSVRAMYPDGLSKPLRIRNAKWPRLARSLCGKFRPGHFQGVVTVVAKLLDVVFPDRLYLGAKDYQQAAVLGQMVKDLRLNVKVRLMPTVREKSGLAMSSRNRYLSVADRKRSEKISRVLIELGRDLKKNKEPVLKLKSRASSELKKHVDRVQYLEIVNSRTLAPVRARCPEMGVLTACFVGKTRLIDNVIIRAH